MRWASDDGVSPSAARSGVAGSGRTWQSLARHGEASLGEGCDGSTEGLRAFPAAFIGGQGLIR